MSQNFTSPKDQPVQPNGRHVVGIDVGLQTHAAVGITAIGQQFGRQLAFTNDRAGIDRLERDLLKPLGGSQKLLVGMEATGHYWMPLYFELKRRGYDVTLYQTEGTHSWPWFRRYINELVPKLFR